MALAWPSQSLFHICSPVHLQELGLSPAKPPGFEASPTPPLLSSGPLRRTPPPVQMRAKAAVGTVGLQCLFGDRQDALLPSPAASPPRATAPPRDLAPHHQKTMAGIDISMSGAGFSISKSRAGGCPKAALAARVAEILVRRSLGIIKDGEDVTAAALDTFAERFKEQLPPNVIAARRGLFKLDDGSAAEVEDALIAHGGGGALDLEANGDGAVAQQEAS
ncbi:hypothetical protein D1007_16880 [Hordeum vulgare]|nr:hypothetical protein D1007_16880 [Hordeum vulgare]